MREPQPVLLLELNELTPRLMFRFMEEGRLPHFRRLYEESRVYVSDAAEEGLRLNPWVQWVTVHTGLPFSEHGVFLLGEGGKAPRGLGDLVSEAGLRVWLCGSMNVRVRSPLRGAAMPDPWATDARPQPPEFEPYFRFVQHSVMEHTNDGGGLTIRDSLAFLRFMATHGISAGTVAAIVRQLLSERGGRYGWKRVDILDRLQWDLFRHVYRDVRPHFASFFLNSVAHLQHTRWRNLEPERFEIRPTPEEQSEFEDAIRFGYEANDRIVGKVLDLAGDDATVIFCTALSQQPDVRFESSGGKCFYRPRDFERLLHFAGIEEPHECKPVMSEEFWIAFEDEGAAREGERLLRGLHVAGECAFQVERRGTDLYAGCRIFHALPSEAEVSCGEDGPRARFSDLLYRADSLKSGVHHPDGLLWIRTPGREHVAHHEKVPLTAIAPTVLHLLGVEIPERMRAKPLL